MVDTYCNRKVCSRRLRSISPENLAPENEIKVVIHPIPKSKPSPVDRSQADHSVKPAVSYGWDWHPRLVPSGIWDETGLITEPESLLENTEMIYSLNERLDKADIICRTAGRNLNNLKYIWSLQDPNGEVVLRKEGMFRATSRFHSNPGQTPIMVAP